MKMKGKVKKMKMAALQGEPDYEVTGTTILSRDGRAKGKTTGKRGNCRLEGCGGATIAVRWSDGLVTHPCAKGLTWNSKRKA